MKYECIGTNQPNKNNIEICRIWLCREPNVDMKDKLNKDSPQTTPSLPTLNLCVPQHTGQSSLFWRFVYMFFHYSDPKCQQYTFVFLMN